MINPNDQICSKYVWSPKMDDSPIEIIHMMLSCLKPFKSTFHTEFFTPPCSWVSFHACRVPPGPPAAVPTDRPSAPNAAKPQTNTLWMTSWVRYVSSQITMVFEKRLHVSISEFIYTIIEEVHHHGRMAFVDHRPKHWAELWHWDCLRRPGQTTAIGLKLTTHRKQQVQGIGKDWYLGFFTRFEI